MRTALGLQGFDILTENDLAGGLKKKLRVDVASLVILCACSSAPAGRGQRAEEATGALLPCSVVVRAAGQGRTVVEALDPLTGLEGNDDTALQVVAGAAAGRLRSVLVSLHAAAAGTTPGTEVPTGVSSARQEAEEGGGHGARP